MRRGVDSVTRQRLETQGFVGCNDEHLQLLRPWLRFGPAICGIAMAAGLYWQLPLVLWALVLFAALGTVLPTHPFDIPYNLGIRRWLRTPAIRSYGMPRRFACFLATFWVSGTAVALERGNGALALVLGGVFLISPILSATTDICVASLLYR